MGPSLLLPSVLLYYDKPLARVELPGTREIIVFRKRWQVWLVAIAVVTLGSVSLLVHAQPANPEVILATTTSTQDSGLLDTLVPLFEQQSGYRVKTISVGTGQALALGERGEADVVL